MVGEQREARLGGQIRSSACKMTPVCNLAHPPYFKDLESEAGGNAVVHPGSPITSYIEGDGTLRVLLPGQSTYFS